MSTAQILGAAAALTFATGWYLGWLYATEISLARR
jgi:hypothetical protein